MAYNKLSKFKNAKIIRQDMISFDIKEKFDAVLSICDGINYVIDREDLLKVFQGVKDHLGENGIFIFDISSYYKLKEIIGDNIFIEDRGNIYYTWQNYFDDNSNIGEFYLNFFINDGCGKYERVDEEHLQRAYKIEEIKETLHEAGFKEIHCFDEFTFDKPREKSERINFVALA